MIAAAGLWVASRMTWVEVRTFDGPTAEDIRGGGRRTGRTHYGALRDCCCWLLRWPAWLFGGWLLRGLAILVALVTLALGYLGVSLVVTPDIGARHGTGWGVGDHAGGVTVTTAERSSRWYPGRWLCWPRFC